MEGIEGVIAPPVIQDVRQKYSQVIESQLSVDNTKLLEHVSRLNQDMAALLFLISSKGKLPTSEKKGNLIDFKS